MKRHLQLRSNRRRIVGLLFVALLYSALVPAGFMPAADGSFSLQVCHSGLADFESAIAGHHSHGHSHSDLCPFGALPAAGPLSHAAQLRLQWLGAPRFAAEIRIVSPGSRPERAHPPRGPPSLA